MSQNKRHVCDLERQNNIVTLNDLDSAAVEALIDFCYTGSIMVERTNVQVLLPAACHLRIEEVRFQRLSSLIQILIQKTVWSV